jgi:cation diffusion facilitator CzcD-associated flavoprotein CzcO
MSLLSARNVSVFSADKSDIAVASVSELPEELEKQKVHDLHAAERVLEVQKIYHEERDKRLRTDGAAQYVDLATSEKFQNIYRDIWADQIVPDAGGPVLVDGSRTKVLVLGAGYGGLLSTVRMIEAGVNADNIWIVDSAGGYGGTWYWNRYPGAMCDVESYIYMPLLEELGYMPKHKYSYAPELRDHAEKVATKWGLRDRTFFQTTVESLTWDDEKLEWMVKLVCAKPGRDKQELRVRSQFVVTAAGVLNWPKVPKIPGIERFQGHVFHTSRWDYAYTGGTDKEDHPALVNLKGKRVGIIGTGATAIQVVPELAKWAKELFVFQRTPSAIDRRDQRETDAAWWQSETKERVGWQKARRENFNMFVSNAPRPPVNLVSDGWTKMPAYSALVGSPATIGMTSVPAYVANLYALDLPRSERVRARVEEIVEDSDTAEKLKAWYPTWCKRPCFHDDYLPSFNQPHVKLVDTDGRGVDSLYEHGIYFNGVEYPLDLLILSTGFQSPLIGSPANRAHISVTGRNGRSLDEKWNDGIATLHGVFTHDFPNLFWQGPAQTGLTSNQTFLLDEMSTHVASIIVSATRKAVNAPEKASFAIEPTDEAEKSWTHEILARAAASAGMAGCTPSYFNLEGEVDRIAEKGQEAQMKAARGGIWGHGIADFTNVIRKWRAQGDLQGIEILTK